MFQLAGMLAAIALTAVCWGVYGPVLAEGSKLLQSPLRAFMCVGVAYFLIAIIVPVALLRGTGEKGAWKTSGVVWSLVAGAAGALGALGVILALRVFQGNPIYVMPLVFGGAPVVNTLLNAFMNKAFGQLKAPFIAGLILVITGAVVVLLFRPQTGGHGPVIKEAEQTLGWLLAAMMSMLSWGAYGPVLHKGQMAMGGSRLRPLICIGIAYFLIAVLVPLALLTPLGDQGNWSVGGLAWSLGGGALGALGALGTILAFACGGKPFTVMPVVFGCAPVLNTFASLAMAKQSPDSVSPFFLAGLLVVAAGAATVLAFGPRGHGPAPKPA
jgi:hypothetical protein